MDYPCGLLAIVIGRGGILLRVLVADWRQFLTSKAGSGGSHAKAGKAQKSPLENHKKSEINRQIPPAQVGSTREMIGIMRISLDDADVQVSSLGKDFMAIWCESRLLARLFRHLCHERLASAGVGRRGICMERIIKNAERHDYDVETRP